MDLHRYFTQLPNIIVFFPKNKYAPVNEDRRHFLQASFLPSSAADPWNNTFHSPYDLLEELRSPLDIDLSNTPAIMKLRRFHILNCLEVGALRKRGQVNIVMYFPTSEKGKTGLARRVSDVHASAVNQKLKSLNCPTSQKLALLDAVIETVKERSREQT